MGIDKFTSDNHYIYYCGQESLRRNEVAIMVYRRVQNAVLGCNLKNDRMISVYFQGKPFNIMVIQAYAPTSNTKCPFHYRRLECKSRKSINKSSTGVTGKFGLGVQNEAGQRLIEFCQENTLVIANTLFQQHKRQLYT